MLVWLLGTFTGDPDQYCQETLYFVIFQGESGPPVPPLDDQPMNWKLLQAISTRIRHATQRLV